MINVGPKKTVLVMAGFLVLSLTLSSCDTLKQKFIRKSKAGSEDQAATAVLEPEDYPSPEQDPKRNYKENYDMIKAWYKDLWSSIDDRSTGRYMNYILTQVSNHIDQMKPLVDAPTQQELDKLNGFLDYYKSSLGDSWQVRNVTRIQSDLRAFDRYMRDHLRADRIQGHFVKVVPSSKTP